MLTVYKKQKGFTLIEMLVVIAIIAVIMAVVITSITRARAAARDVERTTVANQIVLALEQYREKRGAYPVSDNEGCGGWDTPGDGDFISVLKTEGFLANSVKDPQADGDCGNFRYYQYPAGMYGCAAANFYVLGIVDLEKSEGPLKDSPGWACGSRDWQTEMEWATGRYQ